MSSGLPTGRASLLTPPGRGAIAVVAAEGAAAHAAVDAHFQAANRAQLRAQRIDRVLFGQWIDAADNRANVPHASSEDVIVCRTGEAAVEIHCHGGVAAAERILAALAAHGCSCQRWADWIRAHAASPIAAEADEALASALTRRTATLLLDQRHGALEYEITAILRELRSGATSGVAVAQQRVAAICGRIPLGRHLTQPWQIAIAGRPNVGKSSLINALVGYDRAIVFDEPGTTRDVLAAEAAIEGWPVRLTDSAGLRSATDPLEAAGVELARERLQQADLVIWVLDASALTASDLASPLEAARREMAAELVATASHHPLVVLNKADLVADRSELVAGLPSSAALATCALTGAGLSETLAAIAKRLVPAAPPSSCAIPFTERHAAGLTAALRQLEQLDVTGAISTLRGILM